MFTASITSKDFFNGEVKVEVSFFQDTQDAQPFTETFRPRSEAELDSLIKNRILILNQMETFSDNITVGEYTPAPELEPVTPTQSELDRALWLEQWRLYNKSKIALQALADAGITPTAEETAAFENLKEWVSTNRKAEYVEFM